MVLQNRKNTANIPDREYFIMFRSVFFSFFPIGQKMIQSDKSKNNNWVEVVDLKTIGTLLRTRRKQMKLTQNDVAGLCNVGIRFISELENGKPTMQFDKALKVLKRFGFTFGIRKR